MHKNSTIASNNKYSLESISKLYISTVPLPLAMSPWPSSGP